MSVVPSSRLDGPLSPDVARLCRRRLERHGWWLWGAAAFITLVLTLGIASFAVPAAQRADYEVTMQLQQAVWGLVGLVLLFDVYTVYQQWRIQRMRAELADREELFRLITENAADLISVVDRHGRRLYNSSVYERVLGFAPEELKATCAYDQVHPDDRANVMEAADWAYHTGEGRRLEYRMQHKDGSWRHLESTASVIRGERGESRWLVIVNRDITERKSLEAQLQQAQKMEIMGQLASGIAHDFNNLLGVIDGYAELAAEQLPPDTRAVAHLGEVRKATARATAVTRQLLAFGRRKPADIRTLNVDEVVLESEKMLRPVLSPHISLETRAGAGDAGVLADRTQLEQVLLNLAVNARDAMPHGGKLIVLTSTTSGLGESGAQPGVRIDVRDTGEGMSEATRSRIFEPFFTTKGHVGGTGLGMAMVYNIVKQAGGTIHVESELGKGTCVSIVLPLCDPPGSSVLMAAQGISAT